MAGKSQIADRIAARGWSRSTSKAAVDAVLEAITATLAEGERVTLTGFGTFEAAPRGARTARNPRTGDVVDIAATTVARFHPGATLRARVAGASASAPGELARFEAAAPAAGADESPQAQAAGAGTAGTRAISTGTGVTSAGEPADPTRTIHRAKGADQVEVKPAKPGRNTRTKGDEEAEKAGGKKAAKKARDVERKKPGKKVGKKSSTKAGKKSGNKSGKRARRKGK